MSSKTAIGLDNRSGYLNPTFRPIHKLFQDQKLGDTHVLNTSHTTMLTDPKGTIELLRNVR